MNIPQIQIRTVKAEIGLEQTFGKQQLEQPQAELSIQQPKAELTIRTLPSKLTIDQSQAWEDMNLMSILKRNAKHAEEGRQGLLEGIGRRAAQGRELMEIEKGGNPLISQAVENGHRKQKNLGIAFIPSPFSVNIAYEPAEVQIDVTTNKPMIEATIKKPVHHYEPGHISFYMKQYPDIEIDVIDDYSIMV